MRLRLATGRSKVLCRRYPLFLIKVTGFRPCVLLDGRRTYGTLLPLYLIVCFGLPIESKQYFVVDAGNQCSCSSVIIKVCAGKGFILNKSIELLRFGETR
jgi:hypothetical protein